MQDLMEALVLLHQFIVFIVGSIQQSRIYQIYQNPYLLPSRHSFYIDDLHVAGCLGFQIQQANKRDMSHNKVNSGPTTSQRPGC